MAKLIWYTAQFIHSFIQWLMSIRRQLDATSPQWSQLDFQLQLITGKSSIKLISLYKLSEDPIHQQIFRTDVVINVTDFGKDYVEKVRNKTIPLQDLIVYCGHVNIHSQAIQNKLFTFLIGKVSLGRKGLHTDDVTKLDSILIDNVNDRNSFQYNFFLRSHEQYQLKYQANFTVGEDREYNPGDYRCANCDNKQAALFCRTQKLLLCDSCSLDHHRNKIMQNHEIQKVDKINTLPSCKVHNQQFVNYCLRCEKYLCYMCVQKGGSHGSSDHPVYPIQQIYEEKRESNESISAKHKEKVENLLRSLQLKREETGENYTEVKSYIQKQKNRAMMVLEELMKEKSMVLSSDQLQLKMINEKLDWFKAFIKFQEKTLKPIHYFHSQERFEKDLERNKLGEFQSIFSVRADIAVEGDLIVARKDLLDRSKNKAPMTNRIQEKIKESRVNATFPTNRVFQYNASAEPPQRGELYSLLENSQLNFFTLAK